MAFVTAAARPACTLVCSQGQRAQALKPARGGAFRAAALRRPQAVRQQRAVCAQAMMQEWPDSEFIALTLDNFPEKPIATVEEARCLVSNGGYTWLDVRPTLETQEAGKWKQSVNVPIVNSKWVYDPKERKKNMVKEENEEFVAQVQKKFPNKQTPLLIGCSNGTAYSLDALEALDEAGYTNLVGLKGGFYAWFRVFDNKGGRRRSGEYSEQYSHDGDSCGIHSSGAGFARVDAIEHWVPPSF